MKKPHPGRLSRRRFLQGSASAAMLGLAPGLVSCARSGEFSGGGDAPVLLRAPGSLPDPMRAAGSADGRLPFDHVVVVMMENHSFDNYFGMLPRRGQPLADGFSFDASGKPTNANPLGGGIQRAFHLQGTCQPGGVTQSWNASHRQIGGGSMSGFAGTSPEAMGYWDEADIPFYYSFAKAFCLGNRSFCSTPAQTYPNRRFLYSGTAQGMISTSSSTFSMGAPAGGTLMDAMSANGVSWRSYFSDLPALAIVPQNLLNHPLNFSPVAQFFVDAALGTLPAVSFVDPEFGLVNEVGSTLFNGLNGIPGLPASVRDVLNDLRGRLGSLGGDEENPQDISIGENFVSLIVDAVLRSPLWPRTLLVWTYDEHGGYYDHVAPPRAAVPDAIPPGLGADDIPGAYDLFGPRVPTVVASPYSRAHGVSNVPHDHTAVIATIASKWNLPALTWRDANSPTLLSYLDLDSTPAMLTPPTLAAPGTPALGLLNCRTSPASPVIE